jgi:HlyD family type I secretion membrane fusion protein
MRLSFSMPPMESRVTGDRLTVPLSLEDGGVPGIARSLLNLSSALVLIVIIWASFAEIREFAIAEGALAPTGSEIAVDHLEGGIVEEIMVAEGDIVEAGQPLMRLRAAATNADLRQIEARFASLNLEKIGIDASLTGNEPDFGEAGRAHAGIAANQLDLFRSQRRLETSQEQALRARIAQKKAEIEALSAQRDAVGSQLMIQREQLAMREQVLKEGFTSRKDYLDAQSRFRQAEADLASIGGRLATARQELAEARSRETEASADNRRKLLDDQARIGTELAEARQALAKFRDRSDRLYIRAPVRGAVKELVSLAVGKVISPGQPAARLVPIDGPVVAEVQVHPRDIAYVKPGLRAEVTVTALDPNIFGKFAGHVTRVSPSTFETERGETFYRAIIAIDDDGSGGGAAGTAPTLLPGMVVQANIITGAKSVMRYLLKPVARSLDGALSER